MRSGAAAGAVPDLILSRWTGAGCRPVVRRTEEGAITFVVPVFDGLGRFVRILEQIRGEMAAPECEVDAFHAAFVAAVERAAEDDIALYGASAVGSRREE